MSSVSRTGVCPMVTTQTIADVNVSGTSMVQFREEVAVEGAVVTVVLWDTGGALQLQRLGAAFLHRADCLLLLADLSDAGAPFSVVQVLKSAFRHASQRIGGKMYSIATG